MHSTRLECVDYTYILHGYNICEQHCILIYNLNLKNNNEYK